MFQNFKTFSQKQMGQKRLANLRDQMQRVKVDYFLVPHSDEHQNEYLPARAERLAWLTGFTGSSGFAIIGLNEAHVFSDGRYTLQLADEIDQNCFTPQNLIDTPPSKWIEENIKPNSAIGFDPWLITINQKASFEKSAASSGSKLKPVNNLVDEIWDDQPQQPLGSVEIHDINFAGKLSRTKISELQTKLEAEKADCCLLTDPTSISWLFNIRGEDVVHTPLVLSFCLVPASGYPSLFIDKRKLGREVEAYLTQLANLIPPDQLDEELTKQTGDKTVLIDKNVTASFLGNVISNANGQLKHARDPVVLPRAIKNEVEIAGTRTAHLRDGVAVTKFLYWLDQQKPGTQTEITAAQKLEALRAEIAENFRQPLQEISFDTISGAGANGAIVHYRVSEESNQTLEENTLYLVDSGGQYRDGTTDITRTIAIGTPSKDAIKDYTLVMKGHINLALAKFPKGTRGVDLDILARNALWQEGKDYAHGTGHGVGSYLSVHEGPQSISKRGMEPLLPGMIISNEPGYYVEGQYGIRIENLVLVKDAAKIDGGNTPMCAFETLTIAPMDLRLIDPAIMNNAELNWLNDYHAWVKASLHDHLSADEQVWLEQATKPLTK